MSAQNVTVDTPNVDVPGTGDTNPFGILGDMQDADEAFNDNNNDNSNNDSGNNYFVACSKIKTNKPTVDESSSLLDTITFIVDFVANPCN